MAPRIPGDEVTLKALVREEAFVRSCSDSAPLAGRCVLTWKHVIGASRPPLWFASLFPFVMCLETSSSLRGSFPFWVGLCFVTLPFNLLLCGLNDVADWDVDHINPKRCR